jgi:hypothetical protein
MGIERIFNGSVEAERVFTETFDDVDEGLVKSG